MTITAQSGLRGNNDKAQLMEARAEQLTGTLTTPREVCERVNELLDKEIKEHNPPWLKGARALAKRHRAAIVEAGA